ncbi:Mus7/MMS22 family-domain-containing protein [Mycena latifolia]|nr:Mus7/MMS22 family-domain-containing protein [Mycena latifolia]
MDEVVETSDPEELEELRSVRQKTINPSQIRPSQPDDRQTPRKRPKLHHVYSDIAPRTPARSRSSSSGGAVSPRFQSTSGYYTSPASLTQASSPKPSSPIATPPVSVADPSVSPHIAMHDTKGPFTSPSHGFGGSPKYEIRTPGHTPLARRSSSPLLDYSEPASPMVVEPDHPITPSRPRSESVDPLLLFTPSRPAIHDESILPSPNGDSVDAGDIRASQPETYPIPLSPLTPLPPAPNYISPRRSVSPPNPIEDLGIAQALADNQRRYSLRERQAKQLNPYKHDKAQYQITLRNLPEAIVKFRSPRRHHSRGEDYEEVQTQEMDGYEAENDDPRDEARSPTQSRSRSRSRGIPELPSLPSTDEEGKAIDALRKEGRKLRREQKSREVTGKRGRKRVRAFPLKNSNHSNEDSQSPSQRAYHHRSNSPDSTPPIDYLNSQKSPSRRPHDHAASSPTSPAIFRNSGQHPPTPVFQHARSVSPPMFLQDNSDADIEMHRNDFTPPSPQRKNPGSPIVISDNDGNLSSHSTQKSIEQSDDPAPEPEPLSKEEKKQRRRIRALNRMYPAFMRERMMKDAAPPKGSTKRQRSATVSSDSDIEPERPLLPGQTRARLAEYPRDLRDVKGDSESSDDQMGDMRGDDSMNEDEGPVASDSDIELVWHRRKRRTRYVSLQRSSDEEVLSDGRIDDERIEAYLKEAPQRGSGLREKDMIDWMLANTAEVGGTKRPSTRVKSTNGPYSEGSRRSRISITTGGARKPRQTLLSFNKPSIRGRSRDRRGATTSSAPREGRKRDPVRQTVLVFENYSQTPSRSRRQRESALFPSAEDAYVDDAPLSGDEVPPSPPFANPQSEDVHEMPHPDILRKAARRQKEKARQARQKLHGVHIFPAPKGSRIVGQRANPVTFNVADRGFHLALAPNRKRPKPATLPHSNNAQGKPRTVESSEVNKRRLLPRGDRPHSAPLGDAGIDETREENDANTEERSVLPDFGISILGSRIKFGPKTYTEKGQLNELINPPEKPPLPNFFSTHGFDMGPSVTAPQFLAIIGKICDRLVEVATGLPENDNEDEVNNWESFLGATCRVITSLLCAGEETQTLKDAVETHILRLTSKMREASLTAKSMDSTTFTICWFAVEMAIRSGFKLPACTASRSQEPNVLREACTVLIEHLLEYGLERGMEPLVNYQGPIDGSTTTQRVFEAWVGIWHIADKFRDPTTHSANPLWKMVQTVLSTRQSAGMSDFQASENAWRAIISLSTISQSSPRPGGLIEPSDTPGCPACWDIVLFALERIRFEENAEADEPVSESSLDAHDRYLRLVVERCCILWSRWRWPMENAFNVLNRLILIFRSRKFANLRHEKAEFPDFLRVNDWTLLSRPIHSESAFVLFLKLVYQTLLVDKSKVKKLLSLAMPVVSLPWSKSQRPSIHDLSMLFNRFSALTIAIHIDPSQHPRWIQLAREYVRFKDVDATTRNAHIRGWMYLSIVMVQRNIQLDEVLKWLEEMVHVLLDEHRHQTESTVVLGIHALAAAVGNVIRTFKSNRPHESPARYPDPRLLLSLERILRDGSLVKPNNASAHVVPRLIRSFLTARALTIPPPQRPTLPKAVPDQESQDEYGELAFDQDIIAALDQDALRAESEYRANDQSLCKLLDAVCWTLFRQLAECIKLDGLVDSFKANGTQSTDIATLTECWLGCGNIVIQNTGKEWPTFLHPYNATVTGSTGSNKPSWPKLADFPQRRMDFLVFSNVLKLDPMTYLTLGEKFIVVFFESLASWHTTSEDDYIKLLLSIDGFQHPLLKGASWDPNLQKDEISNIGLLIARLPLFAAILTNLSQCLVEGMQDNRKYVGYCISMFSAMKNVRSELTGAAKAAYTSWCLQVYREYQNHPNIVAEPRLSQWMAWAERLNDEVQI